MDKTLCQVNPVRSSTSDAMLMMQPSASFFKVQSHSSVHTYTSPYLLAWHVSAATHWNEYICIILMTIVYIRRYTVTIYVRM